MTKTIYKGHVRDGRAVYVPYCTEHAVPMPMKHIGTVRAKEGMRERYLCGKVDDYNGIREQCGIMIDL